jgi:hypothetical protein
VVAAEEVEKVVTLGEGDTELGDVRFYRYLISREKLSMKASFSKNGITTKWTTNHK